jgi:hypothetical protein
MASSTLTRLEMNNLTDGMINATRRLTTSDRSYRGSWLDLARDLERSGN